MPSFIITGGPGSGKTTLIDALSERGYQTVPEVSRRLIRQQVLAGSKCVPWIDLPGFAAMCLDQMVEDFTKNSAAAHVFFDRGIPDIMAYLKVGGYAIENRFVSASCKNRYEKTVFIAPPWEEIYVNDSERWQTFGEACQLYEAISEMYESQGYSIKELPLVRVQERVDFVISTI